MANGADRPGPRLCTMAGARRQCSGSMRQRAAACGMESLGKYGEAGSLQLRSAYAQQGGELVPAEGCVVGAEVSPVVFRSTPTTLGLSRVESSGAHGKRAPKLTILSIRPHYFSGTLREAVPYR